MADDFVGQSEMEATVYMWATRPDTISNFGWSREPLYLEMNYNGRINLKANLRGDRCTGSATTIRPPDDREANRN
jgi:hypothetical protein